MKKYIKSDIDSIQYKRERLAQDIDRYFSGTDPYGYMDTYGVYSGSQECMNEILQDLLTGRDNELIDYLETDIEEYGDDREAVKEAKSLIKRIKELQYK